MLMGKSAVFITAKSTGEAHQIAVSWLRDNGFLDNYKASILVSRSSITFAGGSLEFVTMRSQQRYAKHVLVVDDHHVTELRKVEAARLERVAAKEQIKMLMDKYGWECVQPSRQFTDGRKEFWNSQSKRDED